MKNYKKNLITTLFFVSISITISCTVDDGILTVDNTFEFLNQNVQGSIDGISFELGKGSAEDSFFNEGELSIDFYHASEDITDPCDVFGFGELVRAFFEVPKEVGLYELNLDLSGDNSRTVTLFNPAKTLNIIATEGSNRNNSSLRYGGEWKDRCTIRR